MAKAGFFYLQDGDDVQCFFCGIRIHKWKADDEPLSEHLKWSEHCGYAELMKKWITSKRAVSALAATIQRAQNELDLCLKTLTIVETLFD